MANVNIPHDSSKKYLQDKFNRDVEVAIRSLNTSIAELTEALNTTNLDLSQLKQDFNALDVEWRAFYDVEWAEFSTEWEQHLLDYANLEARVTALETP